MSAKHMLWVLAVVAVGMVCWTGAAQADVIAGVNYIQPTINATSYGASWGDGPYTGAVGALVDGSGINTTTGKATSTVAGDGFTGYGGGYIVFDLGASFSLTSTQLWNRNMGTTPANGVGGGNYVFNTGGGPVKDVWVSTSLSSTITGSGGSAVFASPVDGPTQITTVGYTHPAVPIPNWGSPPYPAAPDLTNYTGDNYALTTTGAARYVMFSFHGGTNSYYTNRNDSNGFSLQEVRFTPEPATLALLGLGGLGLILRRKRK